MKRTSDPFDDHYYTGITREEPATEASMRTAAAAFPSTPFALKGCIITPTRKVDEGYVVVEGDTISEIREGGSKPDATIIDTNGVILPGLIDLHGHPEYNVFAAWEPPRLFKNRYLWRASDEYAKVVKDPWAALQADPTLLPTLTRYAEIRALVGGATAIQGASAKYPDKEEALVRNVDLRIFGEHHARSVIDLGRADAPTRVRIRQQIDSGEVEAVYIHLAEGVPGNDRSEKEFQELIDSNLLTPATVIIHGTALTPSMLGDVKDADAKLVWSPQSNLRLYGDTTKAADAISLKVTVALGADWLPSGSSSLLGEMKVARRVLADQGKVITPRDLVLMVTRNAAVVAGLDTKLGSLAAGRPADILVLERRYVDPWENVAQAWPAWVEFVVLGGVVPYGRSDWAAKVAPGEAHESEHVFAWGKPMVLDTRYSVLPGAKRPKLADLRASLIARYPQVGPIFA